MFLSRSLVRLLIRIKGRTWVVLAAFRVDQHLPRFVRRRVRRHFIRAAFPLFSESGPTRRAHLSAERRPVNEELDIGPDGLARCAWAAHGSELCEYHDSEWGLPVLDDDGLFERICLEAFQCGLSWLTILRKREAFRRSFAAFEIETVAGYGDADIARLLDEPGIVRNRAKIVASIGNARCAQEVIAELGSLAQLIWPYAPPPLPAPRSYAEIATATPRVSGARAGAQAPGLSLPRPDHRLRAHAGLRLDQCSSLGLPRTRASRCRSDGTPRPVRLSRFGRADVHAERLLVISQRGR